MYLKLKNEQIRNDTNESWKAELSDASYDELIFRLQTLCEYCLYLNFCPGWSYFLLLSRGSYILA